MDKHLEDALLRDAALAMGITMPSDLLADWGAADLDCSPEAARARFMEHSESGSLDEG